MLNEIIANYVNKRREIKGWSISELATRSNSAEGTVKNICMSKGDNPSMKTMIPIMDAIDGSFDEMLYPEKYKQRLADSSIVELMSAIRETNGEHVHDIRTHYQEHREDMKENYEKRLSDKREIIDMQNVRIAKMEETHQAEIAKLEKQNKSKVKIIWILASVLFSLFAGLIALELLHPEHGWLTFRTLTSTK